MMYMYFQFGYLDFDYLDFGYLDFGYLDFGYLDLGYLDYSQYLTLNQKIAELSKKTEGKGSKSST